MNWFSKKIEEDQVIYFPSHLKTDEEGFTLLAQLHHQTAVKGRYVLDFSDVHWIEANLCAVLGAIVQQNRKNGSTFKFANWEEKHFLKHTLKNNGFLNILDERNKLNPNPKRKNSGIPFRSFDLKDEDAVEEYIYKYVLLSEQVPEMTDGAKKKIYRSIFEIYQNSVIHSGAKEIFVCGQFYVNKKRMALTMVELGKTFKDNVCNYKEEHKDFTACNCIEWAVESGNSTKGNNTPGGLGIDLIRDFLVKNEGKLQICSSNGYWQEKKGVKFVESISSSFEGSIVNIEFNLFDKNSYFTEEEIDITTIF